MKKTLIIALIALIITAGITSFVNAKQRERTRPELTPEMQAQMETKRAEMTAKQEEMQNIMANGTYAEWKALIDSRPKITDYITAENFAKFKEARKLKQDGEYEQAQALMEELGIAGKMGLGMNNFQRGNHKMFKMNGECLFQK